MNQLDTQGAESPVLTSEKRQALRLLARLLVRAHLAEGKPNTSKTLDSAGDSNPSCRAMIEERTSEG